MLVARLSEPCTTRFYKHLLKNEHKPSQWFIINIRNVPTIFGEVVRADVIGLISGPQIQLALDIQRSTMLRWKQDNLLVPRVIVGKVGYYHPDDVDAFLRSITEPRDWQPPSITLLLDGDDSLLKTSDARLLTGLSLEAIRRKAGSANWPVLRLSKVSLRHFHSIILDMVLRNSTQVLSYAEVELFFGSVATSVLILIKQGRLVGVSNPLDRWHSFVTTASVDTLLRETLSPFIDPEDWKRQRRDNPCRLVPPEEAARMLVVSCYGLRKMHELGEVQYIRTPGTRRLGAYLTPLCCIEELNQEYTAYSATRIAGLFNTSATQAQFMIDRQTLSCDPHHDDTPCPHLQCLLTRIAEWRNTPTLDEARWFESRQQGTRLLTLADAMQEYADVITPETLLAALSEGALPAFQLPITHFVPKRGWRILQTDIEAFLVRLQE